MNINGKLSDNHKIAKKDRLITQVGNARQKGQTRSLDFYVATIVKVVTETETGTFKVSIGIHIHFITTC